MHTSSLRPVKSPGEVQHVTLHPVAPHGHRACLEVEGEPSEAELAVLPDEQGHQGADLPALVELDVLLDFKEARLGHGVNVVEVEVGDPEQLAELGLRYDASAVSN